VEDVQAANDPDDAWAHLSDALADDGFGRALCFLGVPLEEPFPDVPKGCVPFYRDNLPEDVIDFYAHRPSTSCTTRSSTTRVCRCSRC